MDLDKQNLQVDGLLWEICGIEVELDASSKNAKSLKEKLNQNRNEILNTNNTSTSNNFNNVQSTGSDMKKG
jgi:hypothetical protein